MHHCSIGLLQHHIPLCHNLAILCFFGAICGVGPISSLFSPPLAVMHALQNQIDRVETVLTHYHLTDPGFRLLMSTAGIVDVVVTVILLKTGENFVRAINSGQLMGEPLMLCNHGSHSENLNELIDNLLPSVSTVL